MGLTYDDLIAEGMHPVFLNQLFARLELQSPRLNSRQASVSRSIATPELPTLPPESILNHNSSTSTDVDNFLNTLETSISSPTMGDERSRKRGASSDMPTHPPKRRAFGVRPPRALVIDISDDDSSDEEDNEEELGDAQPKEPIRSNSKIVKIPDRPALRQQVPHLFEFILIGYRKSSTHSKIEN